MTLTSFEFICFFLASLGGYYIVPRRWQWAALLIYSAAFFLLSATPYTIVYLLVSAVGTALCARQIGKWLTAGKKKNAREYMVLGIIINVAMLAALKYNGFIINNVNRVLSLVHSSVRIPLPAWAAPLGISFYTMTALAYLLDSYWGITEPERNIAKGALLVGYWPQLTSGPISRHGDMGSLYEGHKFDYRAVTFGLQRMLWGVFKKLVISARLGVIVDTIYGNTELYNGLYVWLAAALFMMQLYTDFSGCMDIIIGASECYGVTLPENFRTPFFSRSVQEFWQRWHITLGEWMRDYILYSVLRTNAWRKLTKWVKAHWGKKAAKQLPSYLGMLCVWLLMGIWHGGSWKFIIGMGLWFWAMITLAQVFEPVFKKLISLLKINTECFSWHLFQSLRVFVLVCIGNMFFRLDGLITTFRVMKAGLHWNPEIFFNGSLFELGLSKPEFWAAVISLGVLLLISLLQEKGDNVRTRLERQNLVFYMAVLLVLVLSIILIGQYGTYNEQDFLYQNF